MKGKAISISFLIMLILALMTSLSPPAFAADDYDCAVGRHKYSVTVRDPTATTDGEKISTCDLCGYRYTQILPATDHHWGEWITDKPPTCTAPGERHRTCTATAIPHRETQSIPALGHDYKTANKDPTCTNAGVKTYTCKQCGHSYTEPFGQATGHSYKDEITMLPAYDKEGVRTFICEHCGDSYTEAVPKVSEHEHQYKVQSEVKADCEQNGYITFACTICGDHYTDTMTATGHSYGEWITDDEPTLFARGHRHKVCENNPEHLISEDIPQLVTLELNTADAVMAPANTGLIFLFTIFLFSDLYVILWDLRKRCKQIKARNLKIRYSLCAAFLAIFIVGFPMILKLFIADITYMNLLAFTAAASIIPTGILLRTVSRRTRRALNGNRGMYEPGVQKGQLISRNRPR